MTLQFKKLFDKTRAKLLASPERREVWARVESELVSDFQSRVRVRDFTVIVDQSASFGGSNAGPKPTELLLAALAACQEVTYRLYADALGIPVRRVRVELHGRADVAGFLDLDDEVRPGLQEVRGTVYLDSSAAPADLARLQETVEKHCPVLDDLRAPVPVTMEMVVSGTEGAAVEFETPRRAPSGPDAPVG